MKHAILRPVIGKQRPALRHKGKTVTAFNGAARRTDQRRDVSIIIRNGEAQMRLHIGQR